MKKLTVILAMILPVMIYAGEKVGKLSIGDKAVHTDVKMLDVGGDKVSLDDLKQENGILVIFSCNSCPFVLRWEDRYNEIKDHADKNNVGMVVLNSNYQNRGSNDSYEAMRKHAEDKNYNFKYVVDENSLLANAFGGQTTPHVFLFDGDLTLAYKGAIDDNSNSAKEVKKPYLKDAITSLGNGQKVALAETKPTGCSIKRKLD